MFLSVWPKHELCTVRRTDCSLRCACAADGILKMLVTVLCMRMWRTPTHFGTDNVSSQSVCLLQVLSTVLDNIQWNRVMEEQKMNFLLWFGFKGAPKVVGVRAFFDLLLHFTAGLRILGLNRQKHWSSFAWDSSHIYLDLFIGISDGCWII